MIHVNPHISSHRFTQHSVTGCTVCTRQCIMLHTAQFLWNVSPDDPSMMAAISLICSCTDGALHWNEGLSPLDNWCKWARLTFTIPEGSSLFSLPVQRWLSFRTLCKIFIVDFYLQDPLKRIFWCWVWLSSRNNWCKRRRTWWSPGKKNSHKRIL